MELIEFMEIEKMENWIDLSNIPQYIGIGTHGKYAYDWRNSIGIECKFCCEGNMSSFVIKQYDDIKHNFIVLHNGQEKKISLDSIKQSNFRKLMGFRIRDFKIKIGTVFRDNKRNLIIVDRKYKIDNKGITRKYYKYHCNICGWDDGWIEESHLLKGIGCSCCTKHVLVPGINDLYTTNPELIEYFVNQEDTHKTTTCSKKKFLMKCPNCGDEIMYSTEKLSQYGFICKKCGDNFSYGEKFVYSLLKNLNIDYITQLSSKDFSWCKSYKYDFYLPNYNTIVEVHGRQHYPSNRKNDLFGYCHETDIEKENLAINNGIDHYIAIDCRESNLKYIQNSIIDSDLLNILSVSQKDIDWLSCDKFTSKSMLISVCEYKNEHPELSSRDIGCIFKIARTTAKSYLEKGAQLGICIYNKEAEIKYRSKRTRKLYYEFLVF